MESRPTGASPPRNRFPGRGGGRSPWRVGLAVAAIGLIAAGVAVAVLTHSSHHGSPSSPAGRSRESVARALPACGAVCDPIDPSYLGDLRFGATSFWMQPWRAYLDTWPASRLLDAVGINFNVQAPQAAAAARLLHDSGFRLARIGTNWGGLSYGEPARFTHEADLIRRLQALRSNGLRPLILLNSNSGAPCPGKKITLDTLAPAPAGSTTVVLRPASAAEVVPGKTGFDAATFNPNAKLSKRQRREAKRLRRALTPAQRRARHLARRAEARAHGLTSVVLRGNPAILITKVSASGVATLSRPLPYALAPGSHKGTTLLYAPFVPPTLANGSANPDFQATLHGWLGYVAAVTNLAGRIFGAGGYDLEVWNELSFGSQFLNAAKYYSPAPASAPASKTANKQVIKALLAETLTYVRDPKHGISPDVGVTNGFASQTPFPTGAFAPAGLTALSKHPYAGLKELPAQFQAKPGSVPYDARGRRDTAGPRGSAGAFRPRFVPHYRALFPEYLLTASSAETLVRDIAPVTTRIYRAPHGRYVAASHQRPLQLWVTEYNLGFRSTTVPVGPDEVTPQPSAGVTSADKVHFQAKALLRSLVAMVNKGVSREYFYAAANAGNLGMISEEFMSAAIAHPTVYPGDQHGGETMSGFRNLLSQFRGPGPGSSARQLQLLSITQDGNHAQFKGDGTLAHPDLYDREVLAVLPFQSSPTRFTIPVYVMTRDLLTLYTPAAPANDITRFDLPGEKFRITLGNLPSGAPRAISAYDPLTNKNTPAHLTSREDSKATIELTATDYPRILTIDYSRR